MRDCSRQPIGVGSSYHAPEETARETDPAFRHAQRFRAGVEGSISFQESVGIVSLLQQRLGALRLYCRCDGFRSQPFDTGKVLEPGTGRMKTLMTFISMSLTGYLLTVGYFDEAIWVVSP